GGARERPRGRVRNRPPPLFRHRAWVVEVLLEEQRGVARVQPVNIGTSHVQVRCSSEPLPERLAEGYCDRESEEEADGTDEHRGELEAPLPATHARGDERDCERRKDQA